MSGRRDRGKNQKSSSSSRLPKSSKAASSICSNPTHLIIILPLLCVHFNELDLYRVSLVSKEWRDCAREAPEVSLSLSVAKSPIAVQAFFQYFHSVSQLSITDVGSWTKFLSHHCSSLAGLVTLSLSDVEFPQIPVTRTSSVTETGTTPQSEDFATWMPKLRRFQLKDAKGSLSLLPYYLLRSRESLQQLSLVACYQLTPAVLEQILSALLLGKIDGSTTETPVSPAALKHLEIAKCMQIRGMFSFPPAIQQAWSAAQDLTSVPSSNPVPTMLSTLKFTHNTDLFSRMYALNFPNVALASLRPPITGNGTVGGTVGGNVGNTRIPSSSSNTRAMIHTMGNPHLLSNTLNHVYSIEGIKTQLLQIPIILPRCLQYLDVSFTGICNRDLIQLLRTLPNLHTMIANMCNNLIKSLTIITPNNTCQALQTLSLRLCNRLNSIELITSMPSLTRLDVTLCRELTGLSLHHTPRLVCLYLPMLKKLDRLELVGSNRGSGSTSDSTITATKLLPCYLDLTSIYVVGCDNLFLTLLDLNNGNNKNTTTSSVSSNCINDKQKQLLINILNKWYQLCPRMDWNNFVNHCIGGSTLFAYREILLKWLKMKELGKQWDEYDNYTPPSSPGKAVEDGEVGCEDKDYTPHGSTKVTKSQKQVRIADTADDDDDDDDDEGSDYGDEELTDEFEKATI